MSATMTDPARIDAAAAAYDKTYEGPWGLKASAEDVVLSVLVALYPGEFPEDANDNIDRLRTESRFDGLADEVWDLQCEGLDTRDIVERLVPELDSRMAGTMKPHARPKLPTGQVRATVNTQGTMKLYVPRALVRLVTPESVFQPELTDEGILFRYVEGQAPIELPRWMGGDDR